MVNFFEFLQDLIFFKKKSSLSNIEEGMTSSFLMNNWLSGYTPEFACFINETSNKYSGVFSSDKHRLYNFYFNVIPKLKIKKLKYPKKETNKDKEKFNTQIKFLAENLELSQREIKYLIDNGHISVKNMKLE